MESMKKKLIGSLALITLAVMTFMTVDLSFSSKNIILSNIEALAKDEEDKTLWFRTDEDCEYKYTGKAGTSFSFSVGGQTFTGTFDKSGEYTYTVSDGQTDCEKGGSHQCEARYCD